MIKIAVVGTGLIGRSHLEAIEKSPHFELAAVCDINEEKAKKASELYNCAYYTDYRDAAEIGADAVILNLPHFLHCETTVFFLEHGMNVLVEKPMANTVAECDKMLRAAEKSGKKLAVGHVQRFFCANRALKRMINSGELGKLCMASERRSADYFSSDRPEWFLHKNTAGGGIIMNYGAHALDKLLYITGSDIECAYGNAGNAGNELDVDAHAQLFVKTKSGVSADITLCGYNYSTDDNMYYCTDGTACVTGSVKRLLKKTAASRSMTAARTGILCCASLMSFINI